MQDYDIVKNCFAGRKGYSLTLNPESQRAKRLVNGGFIKPKGEKVEPKQPKAKGRKKKVIKPDEIKS